MGLTKPPSASQVLESLTHKSSLLQAPEGSPCCEGIPECAHHSVSEDGTQVVKEQPTGHEIAWVQNDRRQQEEEEGAWLQLVLSFLGHSQDNAP